jgi:hypothetical protein
VPSAKYIYWTLEHFPDRYEQLRKKFLEFFRLATVRLSKKGSRIKGLAFEDHLDEDYFIVTFCGQTFQFRFSVYHVPSADTMGAISCFVVDPVDLSKRKLVTAFSYSPLGVADVKKPEDLEDQVTVNSDIGAAFLVCFCIFNALTL